MSAVASRELRNSTRAVLDRVASGEAITITVDGRPVAVLEPLRRRPRFVRREEFVRHIGEQQADAGLAAFLAELAPDSTEQLPW